MSNDRCIQFDRVTAGYATTFFTKKKVLEDISFLVTQNSRVAIIGQNGTGKSTLLKLCGGFLEPWQGTIRRNCYRIGYAPDHAQFPPFLTVYEFLYFLACLTKQKQSKIKELIMQADLETHAHKKIKHLSRGMKQKLSIIQALLNDPDLLLLDEPFSGIDKSSSDSIYALCFNNSKPITILYTTHAEPVYTTTDILTIDHYQVSLYSA